MNDCCYGEKLIAAGTAIAFQLAQECPPEDLALLGNLFQVIGEQLGLLSGTKAAYQEHYKLCRKRKIRIVHLHMRILLLFRNV